MTFPSGSLDPDSLRARLKHDPASAWEDAGQTAFIGLHNAMIENVPAFPKFQRDNGITPVARTSLADVEKVPATDKDTYLRKYPFSDLSWKGDFGRGAWVISTTSGTTGKPTFFPRQAHQDAQYAVMAEQYLRTNFHIQDRRTLYIIAFALGPWIGGIFTYEALMQVARRGYDLAIFPAGTQKTAVINAIKDLHTHFDQVIIGAYAPHLKDIIEDGEAAGIVWRDVNVKFVHSAEAFPEQLRDYVAKKVGGTNIYSDSLNHYGTVDLGTMAHETPLSVLIRRRLVERDALSTLFPEARRQPTLAQYIPELFYFEHRNNSLHCSSYSGFPLFRYDLKDYGGIIRYDEMRERLAVIGIDVERELAAAGLGDTLWRLPFVFVYERKDSSVTFYAFYISPDQIKPALYQDAGTTGRITGKFTMHAGIDDEARSKLTIHCELAKNAAGSQDLAVEIRDVIHGALLKHSPEYAGIAQSLGDVVKPNIVLHTYESAEFFSPGGKHTWVTR
jgi:phenylacetate-CoA ligase